MKYRMYTKGQLPVSKKEERLTQETSHEGAFCMPVAGRNGCTT